MIFHDVADILLLLDERRTYCGHVGLIASWYYIPCDTSNIDDMRKVYKLTSGRIMIGMASVSVEDEKDAINLKLAI